MTWNAQFVVFQVVKHYTKDVVTIKKILVVDDDKNICELLKLYLKKEGFDVVFAYDGSEAVSKAKSENPNFKWLGSL